MKMSEEDKRELITYLEYIKSKLLLAKDKSLSLSERDLAIFEAYKQVDSYLARVKNLFWGV